tara:strand:- start:306 stop:584 length:279 start_codon:yes stop_codon:yes gene_type:complete
MSKDWWDDLPWHPANQEDQNSHNEFSSDDFHNLTGVEIEGIDTKDHPDYCDAFVSRATWFDRDLTDDELEIVNDDSDFVYEHTMKHVEFLNS